MPPVNEFQARALDKWHGNEIDLSIKPVCHHQMVSPMFYESKFALHVTEYASINSGTKELVHVLAAVCRLCVKAGTGRNAAVCCRSLQQMLTGWLEHSVSYGLCWKVKVQPL